MFIYIIIIIISIMLNINIYIDINKFVILKLLKKLITIILDFSLFIFYFY